VQSSPGVPPSLVPIGSRGNGPLRGVVIVAVLLALAIAKPWQWTANGSGRPIDGTAGQSGIGAASNGAGSGTSGASGAPAAPSAGPGAGTAASSGRSSLPLPGASLIGTKTADPACFSTPAWRVTTVVGHVSHTVRTWYETLPAMGPAPGAAAIPFTSVYGNDVWALGFCAPVEPGGLQPVTLVEARRLGSAGTVPIALVRLAAPSPVDPDRGSLYAPPPGTSGARPAAWPAGRIVFHVRSGDLAETDAWFGVEIIAVPGPTLRASSAP